MIQKTQKSYNPILSAIRFISTLAIVILHIFQQCESLAPNLHIGTDFLRVALVLFFCITAQIYASRTIEKPLRWFLHRYVEIVLPSFILGLIIVLPAYFSNSISASLAGQSILSTLGFQAFVSNSWRFIQLWFLTDILICYALIPFLQKVQFHQMKNSSFFFVVILPPIILQLVFSGLKALFSIPLPGANAISTFYVAYAFFRRYDIKEKATKKVAVTLSILSIPVYAMIVFLRYVLSFPEGSFLASISELVFIYGLIIIGYALYYWLYILFDKVSSHLPISFLRVSDKLSLPIYLVHCHFIGYSGSFLWKFNSLPLGILMALLATFITSVGIYFLTKLVKLPFQKTKVCK